jgi:hypothetical protein
MLAVILPSDSAGISIGDPPSVLHGVLGRINVNGGWLGGPTPAGVTRSDRTPQKAVDPEAGINCVRGRLGIAA